MQKQKTFSFIFFFLNSLFKSIFCHLNRAVFVSISYLLPYCHYQSIIIMKKLDNSAQIEEGKDLLVTLMNIEEIIQKCLGKPGQNMFSSEEKSISQKLDIIKKALSKISASLEVQYLPYLVFLTSLRFFEKLNILINQLDANMFAIPQNIFKDLSKIYRFINSQAPKYIPAFLKSVPSKCKPGEDTESIETKQQQDKEDINRNEREITLELVDQTGNEDSFKNIMVIVSQTIYNGSRSSSSVNNAYIQILNFEKRQKSCLQQQIALNFFKNELQNLRKDKQFLCCKPIFIFEETIQHLKKKFFQFKNFTYSKMETKQQLKPSQQQQQLTKVITAFMNAKGGIIFIGISQEMSKSSKWCKITGFEMEEKNKKQVIKFIRAAVDQVKPKHKGFDLTNEQNVGNTNSIIINFYVSVQFINIVNKKYLENYKNPQASYKMLYVIKIIVKPGHQRFYYHLLVNQGNNQGKQQAQIQFVTRTEDGNSKQSIDKCYDSIYKKLIDYERNQREGKIPDRQPIHDGCRYDMKFTQDAFFLNDEDDDD